MSVLRSTRLMSGSAIRRPLEFDHVRVSLGAGLDTRYDFPNELEVHPANDYAMIAATTR